MTRRGEDHSVGRAEAPTVFLHIGTPKSGTTYLQSRFEANHRQAAAQGLLWPGPSWGRHVAAVRELSRLAPGAAPTPGGPWDKLAKEAVGWGGDRVLISMEWLSEVSADQARAAVESLRPARVEVVCTARDLLRTFVAQGQEMAKNYRTWTWSQLVEEVLEEKPGPAGRRFWRQQDVPAVLERWLGPVPADRVHLVPVPPKGADPEVLWRRFCAVLGVDGSGFDLPSAANESLGVVSTVLMRRLNVVASRRGLPHDVYDRALRKTVAVDVLGPRRESEDGIAVSERMDAYLRERAEKTVAELQGLGVNLHGEWDDLIPSAPLQGRSPESVAEAELLEVCTEALVNLAVSSGAPSRPRTTKRLLDRGGALSRLGHLGAAIRRRARRARGARRQVRAGAR